MTFRQQLEEIAKQREQIRHAEAALEAERMSALSVLPAKYGFPDLKGFIRALREASGETSPAALRKKHAQANRAPIGLARAKSSQEPASRAPSLPTGASLDDPANFGQMPDFNLLNKDQGADPERHARLADALTLANRVLHTSRVPAAIWREWRRFEKEASEALRQ